MGMAASLGALAQRMSRMSTQTSAPPTTSPSPSSAAESESTMTSMMKTMIEALTTELTETRTLLRNVVLPQTLPGSYQQQNGSQEQVQQAIAYDYDQTELSPGIQGVLQREAEEDEQLRLLRERAHYAGRLRELQEEEQRRLEEASSSQGPWSAVRDDGGESR